MLAKRFGWTKKAIDLFKPLRNRILKKALLCKRSLKKYSNIELFHLLKAKVVALFIADNKSIPSNVKDWSGQDIVFFQEELKEKVETSISEKWFYSYFKKDNLEKLPRIDMLNLLSEYAGFTNWQEFIQEHQEELATLKEELKAPNSKKTSSIYIAIATTLVLVFLIYSFYPKTQNYRFCFEDKDLGLPITTPLNIILLKDQESPLYYTTQENGCFTMKSKEKTLRFVVQSPYYKSDTIVRFSNTKTEENIKLSANEYALILHYFSTNNVEDWNTRRTELEKMIAPKAKIYQVFGQEQYGIDVLTKAAFINKITLPTSSLRNMKIIEIVKENEQIVKLKFEILI